jgi:glycosyltransferase involved in cell wall biosynthesis
MRVLHVLAPAYFGGLEQVVYSLAVGQRTSGLDVHVLTLLDKGGPEPNICRRLRGAGVPVISVAHAPRSFRSQRAALRRICGELRPDILHTHGYLPDVLSASLDNRLGAVRVSTVHGFTGGDVRNRVYEWLQRRAYLRFDAVVTVSQEMAGALGVSAFRKRSPRTIPNAWILTQPPFSRTDARARLGLSTNDIVIGWVGRISREKGLDTLIEALPGLSDLGVRLAVIGDGKERPSLQARAEKLGIRVSWCGKLPDAAVFFPAFDLFVLSSRTEGTPIVLFEAMHALVPIVATSVGGVPDVVSSNEALLVEADNQAELAIAMRRILERPGEAATRAMRAQGRLAKDFDPAKWLDAYDAVYREVTASRRAR